MTHEIIKLENYLLVVDDSDIKEGNFVLSKFLVVVPFGKNYNPTLYKKIIAHLPLNNSPILEGVDLLPPLEIDEDFNPIGEYTKEYLSSLMFDGKSFVSDVLLATRLGHNKAREKYIIEIDKHIHDFQHDLRESVSNSVKQTCEGAIFGLKRLKESLSEPKMPIGFECDMGHKFPSGREYIQPNPDYLPKTTTNNLGQTQWVGKYIYA